MNLDDLESIQNLDSKKMLEEINHLPEQLLNAWQIGQEMTLPILDDIQLIVLSGMGGSAIGADLLASYCVSSISLPIIVHRNYGLPYCASGKKTLLVCSSHSGNTEETLDSYKEGLQRNVSILAISTGGKLEELAVQSNRPHWSFTHNGQPRAAVGFSFGLLLSLFSRMGLLKDQSKYLQDTVQSLKEYQKELLASVPVTKNPAKRIAGQAIGRWIAIFGADHLEPVSRRWKTQINELAKAWAQFEFIPESNHNTLAGLVNDDTCLEKTLAIFLKGKYSHPRNLRRIQLTSETFMVAGLPIEVLDFGGENALEEMWRSLLFGDYLAFYLSMGYRVDPTPVERLDELKTAMQKE